MQENTVFLETFSFWGPPKTSLSEFSVVTVVLGSLFCPRHAVDGLRLSQVTSDTLLMLRGTIDSALLPIKKNQNGPSWGSDFWTKNAKSSDFYSVL